MNEEWTNLLKEIENCRACPLAEGCRHKAPGQGKTDTRLMLIGEGPGEVEDREGLVFVGPAGQLLTKMLLSVGITRDTIYIGNIVKCRPPHNRVPETSEAACCMPFLKRQLALVKPRIVVLLGSTALRYVLGDSYRITRDRGKWVEKEGILYLPTFHPSALLRDADKLADAWQDMQTLKEGLEREQITLSAR